jgi:muconolactone delta-isomerase
MEYLVTMTTHVPEGTPAEAVDAIRQREAARSRELAADGHLLRLWRPPLQPGEWRTLGLFAAADDVELEKVLSSMPLRVWRTDAPTPLSPHPNDPPAGPRAGSRPRPGGGPEFLTTFTIAIPATAPRDRVDQVEAAEAQRAAELAEQGHLLRLWGLPAAHGQPRTLGLWQAADGAALRAILASLPMEPWLRVETTALTQHPSDPGTTRP